MISRARLLRRSASFDELGGFVLMSVVAVVLVGMAGAMAVEGIRELASVQPALDAGYLNRVGFALAPMPFVVLGAYVGIKNYQILLNIYARCELASDELAWIKHCPECEQMLEDRELRRLATNVGRVCRTYEATDGLFERFLEEYRALLKSYGSGLEKTRKARIQQMNEAADEGLERNALRIQREHRRKDQEES